MKKRKKERYLPLQVPKKSHNNWVEVEYVLLKFGLLTFQRVTHTRARTGQKHFFPFWLAGNVILKNVQDICTFSYAHLGTTYVRIWAEMESNPGPLGLEVETGLLQMRDYLFNTRPFTSIKVLG